MTLKIVDTHFHFYEKKINNYPTLADGNEKLELLWGKKRLFNFLELHAACLVVIFQLPNFLKEFQRYIKHTKVANLPK